MSNSGYAISSLRERLKAAEAERDEAVARIIELERLLDRWRNLTLVRWSIPFSYLRDDTNAALSPSEDPAA